MRAQVRAHSVSLVMLALYAACSNPGVQQAHEEILAVRDRIRPGMRPQEIESVFKRVGPRHARFVGVAWKSVRIDQSVPEGAAKEWVLWVSLREGRAAAVRIRTKDSELERPKEAPADIVWAQEDDGTPFNKPFS